MSLFTATSGTPERVWALVRLLDALGKEADRPLLAGLLDPRFTPGGRQDERDSDAFRQTIQAASDLGLIERIGSDASTGDEPQLGRQTGVRYRLSFEPPPNAAAFADRVHRILCNLDASNADALVLDGFAVVTLAADRHGHTGWFATLTRDAQFEYLNRELARAPTPPPSQFNTTRLPTWQAWTGYMGLTTTLPYGNRDRVFPYVAPRLAREIAAAPPDALPPGAAIPADTFLDWVMQRMPYLDGRRRSHDSTWAQGREAAFGGELGGPVRVSVLLSAALRSLHEDEILRLDAVGDAADNRVLAEDPYSAVAAFRTVTLLRNGRLEADK